ncbi:MAG: sugar phosphate isomerase/epimerase [Duncaniella sp.]|nr:sugar phosphate isomerase/epimerase [Duncaniella sp.]
MRIGKLIILVLLTLVSLPLSAATDATGEHRYKVAACDWMMLKRQKIGEFKLAREIGADGVEMDMGGLGKRDTFDNKLHQPHFRKLFRETADSLGVTVPSVAMSGFFGQSFIGKPTYATLIDDCLSTMDAMGASVAFLPLGGSGAEWHEKGSQARAEMVKRLHESGEKALAAGKVIGIRTQLPAKESKKLLKEINSKGVKIYFNLQDALDAGLDPVKELKTLGAKNICQIHLSNTDGFNLREDPAVDLPAIKRILDKMGWSGWLVVERSRDKDRVRDVKHNFGRNVTYIKEVFQQP